MNKTSTAERAMIRVLCEWRATEWRNVGRFRGMRSIEVEAKDERKRPVWIAHRYLTINVVRGEATYVFQHALRCMGADNAFRAVLLHGMRFEIANYQEIPADVAREYNRARRRVRALMRVFKASLDALPQTLPRKAKKAA